MNCKIVAIFISFLLLCIPVAGVEVLDTETFGGRMEVDYTAPPSTFRESVSFGGRMEVDAVIMFSYEIRNDGADYFCWKDDDGTLSDVAAKIANFDEAEEYVAVWSNSSWDDDNWCWIKYYGDASGDNANVYQLDIIKVYLTDSGTQTISMSSSTGISCSRTVYLDYTGTAGNKGYNYTCYCCDISGEGLYISDIADEIGLQSGEVVSWWDNTSYEWRGWIEGISHSDYDYAINNTCPIFETKIHTDVSWVVGSCP